MHVLIFKMEGIAYNSTRLFADMLAYGFKMTGAVVDIFDITKNGNIQELEELKGKNYDAVIDFNSKLPDLIMDNNDGKEMYFLDSINGPFYNYIVDHPVYHHKFLAHKLKNYNVICIDENHAEYIRQFYPHIKNIFVEPLGAIEADNINGLMEDMGISDKGIYSKGITDHRKNAILFPGTYLDPVGYYEIIEAMPDNMKNGIKAVIDIMENNPGLTYESAVRKYVLQKKAVNNGVNNTMYFMADIYMRAVTRQNVLEEFARAGAKLVICGEKYDESSLSQYENVKIIPQVSYVQSLYLMHNYRYVLNIMPLFKAGIHDRVVNSMINGAVSISDSNSLMDRYFEKGSDYLCYDITDKKSIKKLVSDINNERADWKLISQNAYKKAKSMTFDKIAGDIMKLSGN